MRVGCVVLFGLLLAGGCSGKKAGGGCDDNADCAAGQVCVNGNCVTLCQQDADCAGGEICVATVCEAGERSDGPVILSINGDGTADTTAGHAPNHIAHSLVITGERLEGSSVELLGWTAPSLTVTSSQPGELVAALPVDLAAGDYMVRVFNAAGEDQGGVTILQGEQGPPGSDADLDGAEIISRIRGAGGGVVTAGQVTTVKVVASGAAGGTRSVSLNGTPVTLTDADGVHLVVVDLDTHTVRTDTSVTGPPFLHNFTMSQPLDGQNLASVIGELDESDVVILATRGDAFAYLEYWIAAAASVGASLRLSTVQPDDGYVLIGRPGLGEGNGIDAVVNSVEGEARAVTVILDDDFLARRDSRKRNAVFSRGSGTNLDCNASADVWRGFVSSESVLPSRTLVTTGGLVHVRFNGWTHTWDSSQARFQVELTNGTDSYTSGACSRAYTNGNLHATSSCDVVLENVPAGVYTVRILFDCYDPAGGTNPDARLYCGTPDSCTFFAEEL